MSNASFKTPPVDPEARRLFLDRLYKAHWLELCRFLAAQYGSGPPEPADVVQTAFAHVAALERPEALANPRAFLYRTARNVFIDQRRRLQTQRRFAAEKEQHTSDDPSYELPAERVLISKEECTIIEAVIRQMPERRRQCFLLHRLHGLSYAEIARRVGMTGPGVRKAVEKALEECERALEAAQQHREGPKG